MRGADLVAAAVLSLVGVPEEAAADNLYRADTIVTRQGEESRAAGFAECLAAGLARDDGGRHG